MYGICARLREDIADAKVLNGKVGLKYNKDLKVPQKIVFFREYIYFAQLIATYQ